MIVPSSTQGEMPRQGGRHSCGVNFLHHPWISWPKTSFPYIHGTQVMSPPMEQEGPLLMNGVYDLQDLNTVINL